MTTTTSETAVAAADGIVEVAKTERTTSIRLSRKALLVSLVEAKRFADVKSSMPILQTVMLRLRNVAGDVLGTSRLEVAATDLNMTYIDVVVAEATSKIEGVEVDLAKPLNAEPIAICLDAKKLHDVVKALGGDEMTVEIVERRGVNDETTKGKTKRTSYSTTTSALLCGKSKFKLTTLSGEDFPKLPSMDGLVWQTMPASTLAELIEGVAFSMSQDTTRAHLNGILLESIWHGEDGGSKVVADKIRVVSTDGHRLSKVDRPAAGFMLPFNGGVYDKTGVTSPKPVSILIPRDAVVELRRRCAKGVEAVDIAVKSGWLYCREVVKTSRSVPASLSTAVYILRLADAQFPPYEQVIPRDCHRHAVVATKDLVDTLKRLMLVASEKTHGMRLRFIETKGSATVLRIETDDAEGNKAEEDVDVAAGEFLSDYPKKTTSKAKGFSSAFNDDADTTQPLQPFIIGVNGEYVLQLLDKIETATTWIGMNNELDPLSFRPAQDEKPVGGDVFVVMPMRL